MKNQYRIMLILICFSVIIAGCKNIPPVTSGIGSKQITPGHEFAEYLQLDNNKLAKKLHISDIKSRENNDLLSINLSLTSRYEKSQQLQYQFQWFDQAGFIIEAGKSPWHPLELHGMQTITVTGLAPSIHVASFSLYVREVPKKFFKF
jgi:uncharacterized protein YcfL